LFRLAICLSLTVINNNNRGINNNAWHRVSVKVLPEEEEPEEEDDKEEQ
jgi:hypothetical protein